MPELLDADELLAEVAAFRAAASQLANPVRALLDSLELAELAAAGLHSDLPLVDFTPFSSLPAGSAGVVSGESSAGSAVTGRAAPRPSSTTASPRPPSPPPPKGGAQHDSMLPHADARSTGETPAGGGPSASAGMQSVAPTALQPRVRLRPPPISVDSQPPESAGEQSARADKRAQHRPGQVSRPAGSRQAGTRAPMVSSRGVSEVQAPTPVTGAHLPVMPPARSGTPGMGARPTRPLAAVQPAIADVQPSGVLTVEQEQHPYSSQPSVLESLAAEVWELFAGETSPDVGKVSNTPIPSVRPRVSASVTTANRTELESVIPSAVATAEQGLEVLTSLVDELLLSYPNGTPSGSSAIAAALQPHRPVDGQTPASRLDSPRANSPTIGSREWGVREALLPPAAEVVRRATVDPPGRAPAQTAPDTISRGHPAAPHLSVDPDDLIELVNQALVEQALRHGVDLS